MSDQLFNKLMKVLEVKMDTIKNEVYSAVENLKTEVEQELDLIIAEIEQEEQAAKSFTVDFDTLTKIVSKGRVIKLEGAVSDILYPSAPERLFLNDRGAIRPPFNTFDGTNAFEILDIELALPSGKVLNTEEVKELFAN